MNEADHSQQVGFPNIKGVGVPIIRTIVFGFILGSPALEKLPCYPHTTYITLVSMFHFFHWILHYYWGSPCLRKLLGDPTKKNYSIWGLCWGPAKP